MKKDKIYIIGFVALLLDQITKFIVTQNMNLLEQISVIPHFFHIHYIQNRGAAWGILQDNTILLTIVTAVALILLNQYLNKETHFTKISILSYGMLLGGMLGNLIDRILYHYVIDFLDFNIFGYHFPVFNIADTLIVCGVLLLVFDVVRSEINAYRSRKRKH